MDFWRYFDVFSIFLCIIYIIQSFLLNKAGNRKYFNYFLLAIAFIIGFLMIAQPETKTLFLILLPLFVGALLSLGPLIFMQINRLTNSVPPRSVLYHFLLPILFFTINVVCVIILFTSDMQFAANTLATILYIFFAALGCFLIQNLHYIRVSLIALRHHQQQIENIFSYSDKIQLNWIKIHLLGYVLFFISLVITNSISGALTTHLYSIVVFVYINFIGIQSLTQVVIYQDEEPPIRLEETKPSLSVKQLETLKELKQHVMTLIEKEQIYLDADLTSTKLAKRLHTNTNYVSILINSEFGINFANFINGYRVAHAKKLLVDPDYTHYTIETIALKSGFKSKSAFNSAFKKFTKQTPSEFLGK